MKTLTKDNAKFFVTLNKEHVFCNSLYDLNDSQRQELAEQFINKETIVNMTTEVEYILGKSLEDYQNAPFCHDDITNNQPTGQIEINGERLELDEEERDQMLEHQEYLRDKAQEAFDRAEEKLNTIEDDDQLDEYQDRIYEFEENTLDRLITNCENLGGMDFEDYPEIYQWFYVGYWLANKLEEYGQCTLDGSYWGRQCCGQSIILDHVIQQIAFDTLATDTKYL